MTGSEEVNGGKCHARYLFCGVFLSAVQHQNCVCVVVGAGGLGVAYTNIYSTLK